MRRVFRFRRNRPGPRGSALLVSLMVIVGLSLLGLGFVAISETESAIAKNQQNVLQTQAIDEGAVGAVEILDAGAAVLLENVRMAPRQETQLPGVLIAVTRKCRVALADQERKARDDDRLKVRVGGRGRQRQADAFCGASRVARTWRDLHAV